jgi:hypothetical protein
MADDKPIERYCATSLDDPIGFKNHDGSLEPDEDGNWVRYQDHLRALGEAEDRSVANGKELCRQRSRAEKAERALGEAKQRADAAEEKHAEAEGLCAYACEERDSAEAETKAAESSLQGLRERLKAEAGRYREWAAEDEREAKGCRLPSMGASARARARIRHEAASHLERFLDTEAESGGEECEHNWVDARNSAVESGEVCTICHAIRAAESGGEITFGPCAECDVYELAGRGKCPEHRSAEEGS